MATAESWKTFMNDAEILATHADKYAETFAEQSMSMDGRSNRTRSRHTQRTWRDDNRPRTLHPEIRQKGGRQAYECGRYENCRTETSTTLSGSDATAVQEVSHRLGRL